MSQFEPLLKAVDILASRVCREGVPDCETES
jgi:hypothetical protein